MQYAGIAKDAFTNGQIYRRLISHPGNVKTELYWYKALIPSIYTLHDKTSPLKGCTHHTPASA